MTPGIKIEFEIEQIRTYAVRAMNDHLDELKQHVEEEMDKAVKQFDFHSVVSHCVRQAVNDAVRDSVNRFFLYGGGKKAISDSVQAALADALDNKGKGE
jgi:DNA-binding protein YbaB